MKKTRISWEVRLLTWIKRRLLWAFREGHFSFAKMKPTHTCTFFFPQTRSPDLYLTSLDYLKYSENFSTKLLNTRLVDSCSPRSFFSLKNLFHFSRGTKNYIRPKINRKINYEQWIGCLCEHHKFFTRYLIGNSVRGGMDCYQRNISLLAASIVQRKKQNKNHGVQRHNLTFAGNCADRYTVFKVWCISFYSTFYSTFYHII